MFERFVERWAEEALSDIPVVMIVGPRRAGKSTLVRKMGEAGQTCITPDDQTSSRPQSPAYHPWLRIRDRNVIGVPGKPGFDYEFSA
nr:hypothetical protein [Bradyrhizobium sp. 186]